jgi:DNA mismatch endonuclease, patch repair protein
MDVHTKEQRHRNMAAIGPRNTRPELLVRRQLHSLGLRYSLHSSSLPGKPDIVLTRHRAVVFVHGCFWHLHACRYGRVKPASNASFWVAKREANKQRDQRVRRELRTLGWRVFLIWECTTKDPLKLQRACEKIRKQLLAL